MDIYHAPLSISSRRVTVAGHTAVGLAVESVGLCWGSAGGLLALAAPDGRLLFVWLPRADAVALTGRFCLSQSRSPRSRGQSKRAAALPPGGSGVLSVGLAEGDDGAPVGLLAIGRPGAVRELACSPGTAAFWALLLDLPVWVTEEDLERWAAIRLVPALEGSDTAELPAVLQRLLAEIDALDQL
jgi:hypothetical protein